MSPAPPRRILVLGGTGTIGRATLRALVARGHTVVALARAPASGPGAGSQATRGDLVRDFPGVQWRWATPLDADALAREGFGHERIDVLVSCLASRTGAPHDAWAVDHQAHLHALAAAQRAGVEHIVQLSALCVQKPRLAFQHAKLAYEAALMQSGVPYTIVRPTAFFKSLSGQVQRVKDGKPFLVFGDGTLTACKPIADDDLAAFMADCVDDPAQRHRILPIGGPGEAITPLQQAQILFGLLGRPMRVRRVPVALMDGVIAGLGLAARALPRLQEKAEFARIGRYYATESMLVWDAAAGRYDAEATPSYGTRTLADHYASLLRGEVRADLGDHAAF